MDIRNCILKENEIIKKFVDAKELPGACFSLVTPDQIVYSCCGHKALLPEPVELTTATLYDIASLSKVVSTSTMLAKLIEDGLLSSDDKVSAYINNFPYDDITILDLIVHTSGYPADNKNYKQCRNGNELFDFILHLPRTYERGNKVEYSCFNYIILGRIIEKLKGHMEDYASEVLFDKLGTGNIMYRPAAKGRQEDCAPTEVTQARGIIQGEVHDGKAYIMGGVAGNAGIFADIETLSIFVQMMLNEGRYKDKVILKKETMELFHQSYTKGLNESRTMGGWFYGDKNSSAGKNVSADSLYHTGFAGTSIYIDYARKCGIVLLSNAIHPSRETRLAKIRPAFHDQLLDYIDRH